MNASNASRALPRAAILLLVACGHSRNEASAGFVYVDTPGGTVIETAGLRIEVEGVPYLSTTVSTNPGTTEHRATIAGHEYGVRDGVFHIGDAEYGKVRSGSKIRVTPDGVDVDGELRGPLPAAAKAR